MSPRTVSFHNFSLEKWPKQVCPAPDPLPLEVYCHSLTDPYILSPELQAAPRPADRPYSNPPPPETPLHPLSLGGGHTFPERPSNLLSIFKIVSFFSRSFFAFFRSYFIEVFSNLTAQIRVQQTYPASQQLFFSPEAGPGGIPCKTGQLPASFRDTTEQTVCLSWLLPSRTMRLAPEAGPPPVCWKGGGLSRTVRFPTVVDKLKSWRVKF